MAENVVKIGGYEFPAAETPYRGPLVIIAPQRWSSMEVLGAGAMTVMTYLGEGSPEWALESRASEATKDKLLAIYEAKQEVSWTTTNPLTATDVLITRLEIEHRSPEAHSKYLIRFQIRQRERPGRAGGRRTSSRSAVATEEDVATIIRKTVDEDRSSDGASFAADDTLILAVGANEVWVVDWVVFFDTGTTPDIKFQFTGPSGSAVKVGGVYHAQADEIVDVSAPTSFVAPGNIPAGVPEMALFKGIIANGATAGNFSLEWAQNTSDAGTTSVLANSFLIAHQQ